MKKKLKLAAILGDVGFRDVVLLKDDGGSALFVGIERSDGSWRYDVAEASPDEVRSVADGSEHALRLLFGSKSVWEWSWSINSSGKDWTPSENAKALAEDEDLDWFISDASTANLRDCFLKEAEKENGKKRVLEDV